MIAAVTTKRRTVVAFNAHPDDEALLTAGTLAKAAGAGHRVVLVVATDGDQGLTSATLGGAGLGQRRLAELAASAKAIGAHRVVHLGYADSGMVGDVPPDLPASAGQPARQRLLNADPGEVSARLLDLLLEEEADVLLSYDANGGYGHRDHVRVHEVGRAAAADYRQQQPEAPLRLLEATVPRDLLARTVDLVEKVYRFPPEFDPTVFHRAFTPAAQITHRVDVRRFAAAKRAAMAAHASQAAADDGADRTLAAFLRLPVPLFRLVFGREWYVDAGSVSAATGTLASDIFSGPGGPR